MKKIKENYRHSSHCPECGQFIVHYCSHSNRIVYALDNGVIVRFFRCGDCKKYFPHRMFPRDRTHKYGIRNNCRKCRSLEGNGN